MNTGILLLIAALAVAVAIRYLRNRRAAERARAQNDGPSTYSSLSRALDRDGYTLDISIGGDFDEDFDDDFDTGRSRRSSAGEKLPLVDYPFHLRYRDSRGRVTEREVKAASVHLRDGRTYLYAFCHKRGAFRSFRADNILQLTDLVTGEIVSHPASYLVQAARKDAAG